MPNLDQVELVLEALLDHLNLKDQLEEYIADKNLLVSTSQVKVKF